MGGNSTLYNDSDLALLNVYTLDMDMNACSAVGSDKDDEMEEDVWSSDLGISVFSSGGYGSGYGYWYSGGDIHMKRMGIIWIILLSEEQIVLDRLLRLPSDLLDLVGEDIIRIAGKDAPFNADTVFIAQIPLKEPYLGKYTYCVGIYACKSGRIPMGFKCYFTNEGKTREKEFLLKFYKTIRYRNNDNWSYDHEKALKALLHELPHKSKK